MRKHLMESDLIEAIIQLPESMFYNTGISTFIWVFKNRKEAKRKRKVQLIDASKIFSNMRKGLSSKSKSNQPLHYPKTKAHSTAEGTEAINGE